MAGVGARDGVNLDGFNALPAGAAQGDLLACCASPDWAARVCAGRPYPDLAALAGAARAALAGLDWPAVLAALAAHPRIGATPAGAGREVAWSRQEQSGVDSADAVTRAALVAANRDYEQRFGHLFLVCASGCTEVELLAAALARLGNDASDERLVVRAELEKIVLLRLERLLRQ